MLKLIRFYIQLIKTPQTGLLLLTAIAGYRSASNGEYSFILVCAAMIGLLMVVSGTTAINMVFDHDIDTLMSRTKKRPLPSGNLSNLFDYVCWYLT